MFNRLRHNRLASTLGQVIWLNVASTQGQSLSIQHRISSCYLGFQSTWHICLDAIPSLRVLSVITSHLVMPLRTAHVSLISLRHPEHPSIRVLSKHWPSRAHAMSFTDTVPNNSCIIQPLTLGLGSSTDTPSIAYSFPLCFNKRIFATLAYSFPLCFNFSSMPILYGVLDDAPSSLVASWHLSRPSHGQMDATCGSPLLLSQHEGHNLLSS